MKKPTTFIVALVLALIALAFPLALAATTDDSTRIYDDGTTMYTDNGTGTSGSYGSGTSGTGSDTSGTTGSNGYSSANGYTGTSGYTSGETNGMSDTNSVSNAASNGVPTTNGVSDTTYGTGGAGTNSGTSGTYGVNGQTGTTSSVNGQTTAAAVVSGATATYATTTAPYINRSDLFGLDDYTVTGASSSNFDDAFARDAMADINYRTRYGLATTDTERLAILQMRADELQTRQDRYVEMGNYGTSTSDNSNSDSNTDSSTRSLSGSEMRSELMYAHYALLEDYFDLMSDARALTSEAQLAGNTQVADAAGAFALELSRGTLTVGLGAVSTTGALTDWADENGSWTYTGILPADATAATYGTSSASSNGVGVQNGYWDTNGNWVSTSTTGTSSVDYGNRNIGTTADTSRDANSSGTDNGSSY